VRYPFECSAVLFEGAGRQPYGSGWYSAAGRLLTTPHSDGESAEQWRGMITRRVVAWVRL
jgi:hypothetical protein